jgi:ParB/RepB/Spo0J family partition protein
MTTAIEPKTAAAKPTEAPKPAEYISVDLIVPSKTNPRRMRNPEKDAELLESIRSGEVWQPIVLRPIKATAEDVKLWEETLAKVGVTAAAIFGAGDPVHQLVAGQRRWEFSKKAGKLTIPAVVRNLTDEQARKVQIIENDQRDNIDPIDRARGYAVYRDEYMKARKGQPGFSATKCFEEMATELGHKPRTLYQIIALENLSTDSQVMLRSGTISESHAVELCRRSQAEQAQLVEWIRIQPEVPSVRRLQDKIRGMDIAAEERSRQPKLFQEHKKQRRVTASTPTPAPKTEVRKLFQDGGKIADQRLHKETPAPTAAQLKKQVQEAAKQAEKMRKAQRDRERDERIEKKYRAAFFAAFASKARISSRLLTHVIPNLLFEVWDIGELPIESFAQNVLQWPAPKKGGLYSHDEIRVHSVKHTRKFTGNLLGALIVTLNATPSEAEKLARYFKVDPKKLRKQAATAVAEEERIARTPRPPATQKEKQLYAAVVAANPLWAKLRRNGASNPEIRNTLKVLMGNDGGMHSQELGDVCYMGGDNPRVWLNTVVRGKKPPTLQGAALVTAVRDLLKIPEKGDVDA